MESKFGILKNEFLRHIITSLSIKSNCKKIEAIKNGTKQQLKRI